MVGRLVDTWCLERGIRFRPLGSWTLKNRRRHRGDRLARIIAARNPVRKGWFGYFKHACHWEFPAIDGFVRRRLRAILRRHQYRPGRRGQSRPDHTRWPNAFFAAHGLFSLTEAHALARRSR